MDEKDERTPVVWDTKIAVVLRDDLEGWQRLNITAFTVSGIAATVENVVGEPYVDGSDNTYLPMFRQPVLVFAADAEKLRQIHERALRREVPMAIYTEELFVTNNDEDNRAAVRAVAADKLRLVGVAMRADRKTVDKIVKGATLHP
ncbi:hypothetical protein CA850_11395 [Micromonospora echinospora]|uniref:DUF2000 family protein n=1 Tax=Micromonospora echinospora TaxID=1877 RepID=A0A1C4ZS38_MICEC|nr:DUF2000 family protein [Micromonospora echinospora]OZV81750.1 hypothetical protein CA850_11395 [Micromonospora echinospora]SCF35636.1 hypothetical protein GA0070618_5675 [Micromonospora echinospora]